MFAENKRYFVDKRIQQQMLDGGFVNFRDYFNKVSFQAGGAELQSLVNAMTVNETYFYREVGRGFAIIGEEIRKLHRRCRALQRRSGTVLKR